MVNLEWYRTFKAIYQNGNLTRASEELLISQPNVSIQLASLESYIGHKLFERTSRRLTPTEYGKLLYSQIVGAIENLEKVEIDFRKAALKRLENLNIGSPIEYAQHILLDKLKDCEVDVNLQFGFPGRLVELIANGELDFAILTKKTDNQSLVYELLVEENFMIIGHATYDTRELEKYISDNDLKMVEKWLLEQKWIAYDGKLSMIRRFWLENFNNRPLIKPHYIIPNIDMMLKAVHLNYGITVASDLLAGDSLTQQQMKIIRKGNDATS
ncbi:MAG: LysR family transcriptional regulator, partial [Bacteroides graminisolvens]|uniref:LysR family transcriptional regulator n=1 Tax=Bacteroides graminisolvens TaxID=477666 RepID=UPI003A835BCE